MGKQSKKDTGFETNRGGMYAKSSTEIREHDKLFKRKKQHDKAFDVDAFCFSFSKSHMPSIALCTAFAAQGISFSSAVPPNVPSTGNNNMG